MADIVEMLREEAELRVAEKANVHDRSLKRFDDALAFDLCSLAADEVERLRARLAEKDKALDAAFAYLEGSNPFHSAGGHRNTDLRDVIRRAREAWGGE